MTSRHSRVRAEATPYVRKVKGEIYQASYKRARRAINTGFYLEAIVLIESMMADRLESVIAKRSSEPIPFRTVGQAAAAVRALDIEFDAILLDQVSAWSRGRSRWVHEFAKVSDEDHHGWRARLSDAHEVALAGFDLATRVAAAAKKVQVRQPTAIHAVD